MKIDDIFFKEDFFGLMSSEAISRAANDKFKRWINLWPLVYCNKIDSFDTNRWTASEFKHPIDTHTAILALIEDIPIKECKHQPKMVDSHIDENSLFVCSLCNAELIPSWKAK